MYAEHERTKLAFISSRTMFGRDKYIRPDEIYCNYFFFISFLCAMLVDCVVRSLTALVPMDGFGGRYTQLISLFLALLWPAFGVCVVVAGSRCLFTHDTTGVCTKIHKINGDQHTFQVRSCVCVCLSGVVLML